MLAEEEAPRAWGVRRGFLEEGADAGGEASLNLRKNEGIEQHSVTSGSSSISTEACPSSEIWGAKFPKAVSPGGCRKDQHQDPDASESIPPLTLQLSVCLSRVPPKRAAPCPAGWRRFLCAGHFPFPSLAPSPFLFSSLWEHVLGEKQLDS